MPIYGDPMSQMIARQPSTPRAPMARPQQSFNPMSFLRDGGLGGVPGMGAAGLGGVHPQALQALQSFFPQRAAGAPRGGGQNVGGAYQPAPHAAASYWDTSTGFAPGSPYARDSPPGQQPGGQMYGPGNFPTGGLQGVPQMYGPQNFGAGLTTAAGGGLGPIGTRPPMGYGPAPAGGGIQWNPQILQALMAMGMR